MRMSDRDENNVIMPVRTQRAAAEALPGAREQTKHLYRDGQRQESENEENAAKTQQNEENAAKTQRRKPIGKDEIAKAKGILQRYIANKKRFDERFRENYELYNLLLESNGVRDGSDALTELIPETIGAQGLNVIMNKHADAMDNYPEPILLPRSEDDEQTAKELTGVVQTILEQCGFDKAYSDVWYDKLVGSLGVYAVIWNSSLMGGLGDIEVLKADPLSLFWQPHITDIQDSANLFYLQAYDVEEVREMYPQLEHVSAESYGQTEYKTYDSESKFYDKAVVVDWYYKKDGKVHLCKFCGDEIIAASENDPETYPDGYYAHGMYPFEADRCFFLPDTPASFSMMDVCRNPQKYLDMLNKYMLKNVAVNSQTRSLYNRSANVNAEDLNDLSKDFIEADGNLNDVTRPLETKDIAAGAMNLYASKIEEIKQTTGTNDASNGASAAGVTSGNAIAALQEAGGKISRDLCKQSYFCMTRIYRQIIELIREKYTAPRLFRITGNDNRPEFIEFDNAKLRKQQIEVEGSDKVFERLPVIDIKIKAQRANPFATLANNEMMMNLFRAGAFAPGNAEAALIMLEGMVFEGKEKIVEMVRANQTMQRALKELEGRVQMQDAMIAQQAAAQAQGGIQLPAAQGRGPYITDGQAV